MSRWGFYGRVSAVEQVSNNSIPTQLEACYARAREQGATEIIDFIDAGVPGDLDWTDRPALTRLLEQVEQGRLTGVIVYDPDRLARDLGVQLAVTDLIIRHRVQLEFCTQQYDASPEGLLFYQLRGAIAQFERAKIRERTNRGRKKLLRSGIPANKPPVYGLTYDRATNTWAVLESEATIVRQMFAWAAEGESAHWIARRLNQQGTPPPRGAGSSRWWAQVVQRMLASPTYAGRLYLHRWNEEGMRKNRYLPPARKARATQRPVQDWVEVAVPALIAPELWRLAQDRLQVNRRRWAGVNSPTYVYLASRLLRCGLCGSAMTGASARRKYGRTHYYRCNGRFGRQSRSCTMPHLRAAELDAALWQAAGEELLTPERLRTALNRAAGAGARAPAVSPEQRDGRRREIQQDIARLEELIASKAVREYEVRSALRNLREEALALGPPAPPDPEMCPAAAPEIDQGLDAKSRQVYVRELLTEIVAFPDGRLLLTPRCAPDSPAGRRRE